MWSNNKKKIHELRGVNSTVGKFIKIAIPQFITLSRYTKSYIKPRETQESTIITAFKWDDNFSQNFMEGPLGLEKQLILPPSHTIIQYNY